MGKDTKIGLLVGVLVVVLFALVFFGGGSGSQTQPPEQVTDEPGLRVADRSGDDVETDLAGRTDVDPPAVVHHTSRGDDETTDRAGRDTGGEDGRRFIDLSTRFTTAPGRIEPTVYPTVTAPLRGKTREVKSGDCYYTIAKVEYGNASLWPIIKAANGNRDLFPGMKLVIPPKPAAARTPGAPAVGPAGAARSPRTALAANECEVKVNDSLWKIAARHFGDGSKYLLIYEANKDKLKSPDDTLSVGMRLTLPPKDAVRAARTTPAVSGVTRIVRREGTRRPSGRSADID